jgi:large repetitive protein
MARDLTIKYTLQSGSLPDGLSIDAFSGKVIGSVTSRAVGLGPVWSNSPATNIGPYDVGDSINLTLSAPSADGSVKFALSSDRDFLPWGITLDTATGNISGTIAPLKLTQNADSSADGPIWNTEFGKLLGADEDATVNISVSATPRAGRTIRSYAIAPSSEGLPWGLVLNHQTGAITGSIAPLKSPGTFVEIPKLPTPVWNTPSGSIAIKNEGETVNATFQATPAAGRSMAKYIITSGSIPWGLYLHSTTGVLSGTLADNMVNPDVAPYIDPSLDPVISDTVSIQGSNQTVIANGSLGSYAKGSVLSITFSSTFSSGRSLNSYYISDGDLPFGLVLNGATGVLSGTISLTRAVSKTYTFSLSVRDKNGAFNMINTASRTYSITVQ